MSQASGPGVSNGEATAHRLAIELHDVEAAIELVRSGVATRVTMGGLRFAEAVMKRLRDEADRAGVVLDPLYWPEDAGCDVTVRRIDVEA
jgi:hypothetical protein